MGDIVKRDNSAPATRDLEFDSPCLHYMKDKNKLYRFIGNREPIPGFSSIGVITGDLIEQRGVVSWANFNGTPIQIIPGKILRTGETFSFALSLLEEFYDVPKFF